MLVERFLPLARHLAHRYARSGESFDDVFQVACLALIKAIDRFDPDRGVAFSTYATPTVLGEIKRHFRDTGWAVHVPRDLQESGLRAAQALTELTRRLGRRPTVGDVAGFLGWAEEEVLEALQATTAYRAASLDAARHCEDEADVTLAETLGYDDERFSSVEWRTDLRALSRHLSAAERAALWLRFELGLTQPEIGDVLGLPPAQVSRTLRRALGRLRTLQAQGGEAETVALRAE